MDMDMLMLLLISLGISVLIGVSMIIPNHTQWSCCLKPIENGWKAFSWWFFIGMLSPVFVFLLLGGILYILCIKGLCGLENLIPLLSVLGVLWLSFMTIKVITPLFVMKTVSSETSNYKTRISRKEQSNKSLVNYIVYALLFSVLFFSLLFVNVDSVVDWVRNFIINFGVEWNILETPYFEKTIARVFYVVNISALIGVIATLKSLASDTERKGKQYFQEEKLREFESKLRG